jgi:hypothetical protein
MIQKKSHSKLSDTKAMRKRAQPVKARFSSTINIKYPFILIHHPPDPYGAGEEIKSGIYTFSHKPSTDTLRGF